MKLQVVSVRDRALDAFGRPIFVPAVGVAIRSFQDEVNNKESEIFRHPEDYDLYHLGEFDDGVGRITCFEVPVQLALGSNLKRD